MSEVLIVPTMAEMLAQGLKDWKRAIIIGERTLGLYIIRTVIPLKNCAGLYLPTSEFFSPDGNNFRNGVVPDIDLRPQGDTDVPFEFSQSLLNKIDGQISYERLREMAETSRGKVVQ